MCCCQQLVMEPSLGRCIALPMGCMLGIRALGYRAHKIQMRENSLVVALHVKTCDNNGIYIGNGRQCHGPSYAKWSVKLVSLRGGEGAAC